MFTGIIEEIGKIKGITHNGKGGKIVISAKKVLNNINLGDSICVDGICLTATEIFSDSFSADFMPETYKKTKINYLKTGSYVNLERALLLNGRLGGHIVTGHVDGIGKIINKYAIDNSVILKIQAEKELLKYIVKKGSVALDGVSLTVFEVDADTFSVSLIPHTYSETTLYFLDINCRVNIETDILAKYLEKLTGAFANKTQKSLSLLDLI